MSSIRVHVLIALGLALLAGLPCAAQPSHASSALSSFTYSLTDLAPDDGQAPAVVWGKGGTVATANVDGLWEADSRPFPWGDLRFEVVQGASRTLSVTDATSLFTETATADNAFVMDGSAHTNQAYLLSPNTAITFTVQAQVSMSNLAGGPGARAGAYLWTTNPRRQVLDQIEFNGQGEFGEARTLTVTLSNRSGLWMRARWELHGSAALEPAP